MMKRRIRHLSEHTPQKCDFFLLDTSIDLNQIINYNFSFDFNDAFLASFAKLHNYMILTDDKDFSSYTSGPDIITNNKALLMFS